MAFDATLVERVRDRLADRPGVTDKRMFGTFALRVGRDGTADALTRPGAREFDMTGRPMKGWVLVDGAFLDDEALTEWIGRACDFVGTLPPK
jgi:hypothetical protein